MEFFDWMGIPQTIIAYMNIGVEQTIDAVLAMQMKILIITLYVAAGLYLIGLIFGGLGLYKMAKKAGDKLAWMAFVPVLNTFLAGRVAGETSIFGVKIKRIGLYAALIELIYIALNVFTLFLSMYLSRAEWNEIVTQTVQGEVYISVAYVVENMPLAVRWMPEALEIVNIIQTVWYFIAVIALFLLYLPLYRKYYARGPMIMAFLSSFFPFRGFVLFAVRNNAPVDYNQWMQERLRQMQQQQRQQQNMYGGYGGYGAPQGGNGAPQNGNGAPQNGNGAPQNGNGAPEEPFGDYNGRPQNDDDEPFKDI